MGQLLGVSENQEDHLALHDNSFAQVSKISVPVSGGFSLSKIHDLTVENDAVSLSALDT
jgi:hypothetical protein